MKVRLLTAVLIAPVSLMLFLLGLVSCTSPARPTAAVFSFPAHPHAAQLSGHVEPEVKKFGSVYYLYYRTDDDDIAVATSLDGATWREHGITIARGAISNLLANSNVENGTTEPDSWFHSAKNTSWDPTQSSDSSHSLKLTTNGDAEHWRAAPVNIYANQHYILNARVKGTVTNGQAFLAIRWFSAPGGTGFISEDKLPLSGSYGHWTKIFLNITAPNNAVSADVLVQSIDAIASINADDFVFGQAAWDANYVISPSAESIGNNYYLFYEGNDGARSAIGYAIANNPLGPFRKSSSNPILIKSGDGFESQSVGTPTILHINGKWYLYYHGYNGTNDQVGLAWSNDLGSWARSPRNPVLSNAAASWTSSKVAPSSAVVLGDYVYVFIEGLDSRGKWQIGAAQVLKDALEKSLLDPYSANPLFTASTNGWDDDYVQLPGVFLTQDSFLWLYYSGHNAATDSFALGRAVSSLPVYQGEHH